MSSSSLFILVGKKRFAIYWCATGLFTMLLSGTACRRPDTVRVHLQAHSQSGQDMSRQEIRAQVSGVQAGLHYKWVADSGQCDPQESDWPSTIFSFAFGTSKDRVTAEVWRDNVRVAHERIDVMLPDSSRRPPQQALPTVQIFITGVPPFEPHGGEQTHAEISGSVTGEIAPDQKVVVYALADDAWYIQPTSYKAHAIRADHTWGTWTHTGSDYAALVVRPGFMPAMVCDRLPQVGGDVLARVMVEGKK
jgi:hypothetical protein